MKPKLILCLALVLNCGLFGCSTSHYDYLSVKQREQVKNALATLRPGMTKKQVEDTLAKTPWKHLDCLIEGGGSRAYCWDLYSTENAANLLLVFDGTANPPKFLKYELCGDGWKIDLPICYYNTQYDLTFYLPVGWKGYSVLTNEWDAALYPTNDSSQEPIGTESGPIIALRHPLWRTNDLYQDIPIMVFTYKQWDTLRHGKLWPSTYAGGVIGEMWHNDKYVFGLYSRYNAYDDVKCWKEADDIIATNCAAHPEPTLFPNP